MTVLDALPVTQAPVAVLDFETTGLDPEAGHRVVEVAVRRRDRARLRELSLLLDPQMPIPETARAVHGIDDAMVAGMPTFAEVADRVLALLDDAVIVGHNAEFDLAFLRAELRRAGRAEPTLGPVLCTLGMARNVFGLARCNLEALAARVGVVHEHPHRALPDVRATHAVFEAMLRSSLDRDPPTVGELLAEIDALRKGGPGRAEIAARVRQAAADGTPLTIDYTSRLQDPERDATRLATRRTITITRLRMPYVEAWCHLRQEHRVFRVDRIRRVVDDAAPPREPARATE